MYVSLNFKSFFFLILNNALSIFDEFSSVSFQQYRFLDLELLLYEISIIIFFMP